MMKNIKNIVFNLYFLLKMFMLPYVNKYKNKKY